ncbi:MAG: HesA/MoeB/ThiF family protein [Desulfurococcaceae archaeon]
MCSLTGDELERYDRQLGLFGEEGQLRLKRARVLVAGLGGLGSAISLYLAAAGVGNLYLVDKDVVSISDLQRQVLYGVEDLGRPKAYAAAARLQSLNPMINIYPIRADVFGREVEELEVDIYVDALDNWPARARLDELAWRRGKPLVHGGVEGFYGQATVIIPGKTPCLRAIMGWRPQAAEGRRIQVAPTTPGIIGLVEANEVLKLLLGVGETLAGRLLIYNGLRPSFEIVEVRASEETLKRCSEGAGPASGT